MYTNEELEYKVQQFLKIVAKDYNLSKLYTFKINIDSKLDSNLLTKLTTEPFIIKYDDSSGKLFYIDEKGDYHYCPEIHEGVSSSRDWISDSLPMIPFDINQGGNLRKSIEAENMYRCTLIAGIIKGSFLLQFNKCCEGYDFRDMRAKDLYGLNFTQLLTKWQDLQNFTIRIIVSGANYKISAEKNLEVGFLIGSLNKDETLGVISIRDRVKSIIRGYMLGPLSPNNVIKMTKIERLIKIQEKDDRVLSEINSSTNYSELYKICSINSDYLSADVKNLLSNYASDFSRKEVADIYKDDENGFKKFISVCRRRSYKEAVIAFKEKELNNWREVGNMSYKLPSKK